MKKYWWLIAIALVVFFGNAELAVTDPVESNYTLTAKEMLAAGDYISPRIYGNYWYDKPIFFYWELIAAFGVAGISEAAARFFPGVFALLNLVLTYRFGRRLFGERLGLLSAIISGSSVIFYYLSKAVITDMTFVFFFNCVLLTFYRGYSEQQRRWYLASFFFAGLAVLTKGPIGILLPGLIMLIFLLAERRPRELLHLRWLPGLAIFIGVGGIWYWQMYQLHGTDFLLNFLGVHNFLRATVSEHPRFDVWYYYIVIFLLGLFPWSLGMVARALRRWRDWRTALRPTPVRFLLIWALTVNIVFQLMATKYPTYTLPALLPCSLLGALLLAPWEKWIKRLGAFMLVLYLALTYFLAIPLCAQRSEKDFAATINAMNLPDNKFYSFSDYRTSLVYYTGRSIAQLKPARDIQASQPDGISWKAKNVMPFQAIESLPIDEPFFVICDSKSIAILLTALPPAEWQVILSHGDQSLLKITLTPYETTSREIR